MKKKISNKLESMLFINYLGLNILPQKTFMKYNIEEITKFIKEYPAEYYAIRDKSKSGSKKHQLAVECEDIVEECKGLSQFSLNVSSYCYREHQICVGEIRIWDNMQIEYILSNNPEFSVRDCYAKPDYKGVTDIYDKKIKKIKGYDIIVDYILEHDLTNLIVEFTIFDCKLGTQNENVVIWELRTEY